MSEIFNNTAVTICPRPSVAINEFTLSFTTMKPDNTPNNVHANTPHKAARPAGMLNERWKSSDSHVVMHKDSEVIAPIDKSKEFVASGTKKAKANMPIATFSFKMSLKLATLKKVSGFQIPKIKMKAPARYKALSRSMPKRVSIDFCGALAVNSVVDTGIPFTNE